MSEEIENHSSILILKSTLFTQSSKQEREKRRFWGGLACIYIYVICILLFEDILYPNKMLDHAIFSAMRQLRGYRHLIRRGGHAADASVFGATNDVKQEKL